MKCTVEQCNRKAIARGLCTAHYQRVRRGRNGVDASRPIGDKWGANNPNWKGGEIDTRADRRVQIYNPEASREMGRTVYDLRYRKRLEERIGRKLGPKEVAHHENQNPADDRPNNLEPMSASAHMSYHMRQRWSDPEYARRQTAHNRRRVRGADGRFIG